MNFQVPDLQDFAWFCTRPLVLTYNRIMVCKDE